MGTKYTVTETGQLTVADDILVATGKKIQVDKVKSTTAGTFGHVVPAVADDVFTLLDATQTLTNKTLTNPTINGGTFTGSINVTGTTSDTFTVNTDGLGVILDSSGQTSTHTFTFPDADTVLVGTTTFQSLSNKTLVAPIISTIVNTGTLTLPTSTDTLIGRDTTDTLTNKTIAFGSNTLTDVVSTNTVQTISGKKTFNSGKLEATDLKPTGFGTNGHTIPGVADDTLALLVASQSFTNKTIDSSTNTVRADKLSTTGSPVVVSASAPPTTGQILIATSATTATWQNPPSNGHTIQEEGVSLPTRTYLNFTGSGITASDDSGNDATIVYVPISNELTTDDELITSDIGNDTEVVTLEFCPTVSTAVILDNTLDSDNIIGDGLSKAGLSVSTGRVSLAVGANTITVKNGTGTVVSNIYSINFNVKGASPELVYLEDTVGNDLPKSGNTFTIFNADASPRTVHFQVYCD